MASFRLLVLAFVREYLERYGVSPSQGEIRHALDTTRTRVRDALRSLEKDGHILRAPGARGIALPSMRDDAVRRLRALGWVVDEDACRLGPPRSTPQGPHSPLLPPPELDYPATGDPLSQDGDGNGKQAGTAPRG